MIRIKCARNKINLALCQDYTYNFYQNYLVWSFIFRMAGAEAEKTKTLRVAGVGGQQLSGFKMSCFSGPS